MWIAENRAVQPSMNASSFYSGGTKVKVYCTTGRKARRMLLVGEAANHS